MPIELKIPPVGESITEVQIAEWLKAEGDSVKKDEPLVKLDSEKTTFDLPAPESGTLTKILHQAGATLSVGSVIGQLEAGAAPKASKQSKEPAAPAAEPAQRRETKERATAPAEAAPARPRATGPAEKAIESKPEKLAARTETVAAEEKPAEEKQNRPVTIEAPKNKEPHLPPPPRPMTSKVADDGERDKVLPMSMLRRTVSRRLVDAQQNMAMLTTFNEADMATVQALRKEHAETFEKRHQTKLGLSSFFVRAVVDALKQFPQLNAEIRGDDIVYHNYFDIGVAIGTGRGLVVPVLRQADRLSFSQIEKAIADFAARAKDGQLKTDELEGGTFTITNGGVFGSLLSTPIINPPQTGILGMHTIQERPVAREGQVVIRPMMYLALTYDHRLVDGREAVLFLRRIKEVIESPVRLLMEA